MLCVYVARSVLASVLKLVACVAGLLREADALSTQAARLNEPGSAGYPDEEDFAYFVAEAGFAFAIVQDTIPEPLVYGSDLDPICLTVQLGRAHV